MDEFHQVNRMKRNIFIEGLPGSGKSTLLNRLAREWPQYRAYREGDLSPVELAWCSLLTREKWEEFADRYPHISREIRDKTRVEEGRYIVAYTQILAESRAFYQEMEQFEIYNGRVDFGTFRDVILGRYRRFCGEGNLFECSLLQNAIESMMLFYELPEEEILAFYEEACGILRQKGFKLIYLDAVGVRENLLAIKKERSDEEGNELWYPMMFRFLKESPWGEAHGCEGLEDVIVHFERRRKLELRILREIVKEDGLILEARGAAPESVLRSFIQG